MKSWIGVLAAFLVFPIGALADTISFSTFVSASSIAAVEGQNATIAFNFAGNKFVGSVYNGVNNNQLYSTSLTGGSVAKFSTPIPGAGGEVVVGASLGLGGFAAGDIYAGSEANGQIYHITNAGGAPVLFATLAGAGGVRQVFFDPGSTFGGNMIVTTSSGQIYTINSSGVATLLVNLGADAEGIDIASAAWGPYAGYLLVTQEGSGVLRVISPTGVVVKTITGLSGAETVSTIPTILDLSDPLEGFYVANFAQNIQFASAGQFISQGLLGDVIVTDEFGGSTAWDVHYNSATDTFTVTPFSFTGNAISQFEDGIFVTPQRISDITPTPSPVPEPSSLVLLGTGIALVAGFKRKFIA